MEDFLPGNWWVTSSGTNNWSVDYTRHRSGVSETYLSPDDIIGATKSGKYRDNEVLVGPQ